MGMAASQARFLGLTARKTNVEYEGQQVNQQRTTLANETANYYNQLLGMTVPTPPSVADYTKTVYTFTDGNLNNSVTSLIAQQNGTYLVSYVQSWTNDFAPVGAGSAVAHRSAANTYMIGSQTLREIGLGDTDVQIKRNADGTYIGEPKDDYLSSLSKVQLDNLEVEEKHFASQLTERYGSTQGWYIRYVQNTSTGTWSPYFYNKNQVIAMEDGGTAIYDTDSGISQSGIKAYTMGPVTENEEVKGKTARLEKDSTGRYINITIYSDAAGTKDPVTYALTTNTLTDQDAYDDAMNQYEYNKYEYDQAIQNINSKIEIIQTQDKNLELRLKQLDTEQDAIQTEMDAVQKVIEKNTESTFKTFG